jgi:hypothetical protein
MEGAQEQDACRWERWPSAPSMAGRGAGEAAVARIKNGGREVVRERWEALVVGCVYVEWPVGGFARGLG